MKSSARKQHAFGGAQRCTASASRLHRFSQNLPQSLTLFTLYTFFTVVGICASAFRCDAQTARWVSAYYAGWQLGDGRNGYLPVSKVDFSAFTHIIHFALIPRSDGTLDSVGNSISTSGAAALIKAARAYNAKVLICVGGAGSEGGFIGATDSARVGTFVHGIADVVRKMGYDGVDIDWEPIDPGDYTNFTRLAEVLHDSLKAGPSASILTTTCVGGNQDIMARDQVFFDQINIMTYDMSFPSSGWVVWYNSPLYDGGLKFPGLDEYVPSIDADVREFEAAGVTPGKIGVGAEFGGTVWEGVTLPGQLLSGLLSIQYDVPLYAADGTGIMQKYYQAGDYHWDPAAQVGYLSINGLLGITGEFISYDDSNSIRAKAQYVDSAGIGGIILYELGMGYPGNGSYPLVNSVKNSFQDILRFRPPSVPYVARLEQNYPHPFNPSTTITFETTEIERVDISVYDILGRKLGTLMQGLIPAGTHTVQWDGAGHPSGLYLCRLLAGNTVLSKKMLLIK